MALILAIPAVLLSLGLFVWAIFDPWIPTMVILTVIVALDAFLLLADFGARTPPSWLMLVPHEEATFRRHHIFLRFPGGAGVFCLWLQTLRWSGVLWVPLLLLNALWIPAVAFAVHFVVTSSISVRLQPVEPYKLEASQGNREIAQELQTLLVLLERLNAEQPDRTEEPNTEVIEYDTQTGERLK